MFYASPALAGIVGLPCLPGIYKSAGSKLWMPCLCRAHFNYWIVSSDCKLTFKKISQSFCYRNEWKNWLLGLFDPGLLSGLQTSSGKEGSLQDYYLWQSPAQDGVMGALIVWSAQLHFQVHHGLASVEKETSSVMIDSLESEWLKLSS